MTQNNEPKTWEDILTEFEKQFPKGECKERGQAMVVMAYAKMVIDLKDTAIASRDALIVEKDKALIEALRGLHTNNIDGIRVVEKAIRLTPKDIQAEIETLRQQLEEAKVALGLDRLQLSRMLRDEGFKVVELKEQLSLAVDAIEFIGGHTDHGDQDPCIICQKVDEALLKLKGNNP